MSDIEGTGGVTEASEQFDSTESEGDEASQEVETEENDEVSEGVEADAEDSEEPKEEDGAEEEVDLKQMYRVEVNGESFEVPLEELVTGYQLKRASYDKFQEAARLKSSVEQFVAHLQENPIEGLKTLGYDEGSLKELVYSTARKMLEEDGLPEEKKKEREREKELERLRAEKEALEKEQQTQQMQVAQKRAMEEYNKAFTKALESSSVPATPAAIKRMAQIMHTSLSNGYDMTVDEAASFYKEEQAEIIRTQLGGLSGEQLNRILGKEQADKMRKENISKIKNPTSKSKNLPKKSVKSKATREGSLSEFLSSLKP